MTWQDTIFGIGNFVFALSMLPTLLSKTRKPSWSHCLLTAGFLGVYVVTFASLGMWLSAVGCAISTTGWSILLVQSLRLKI